MGESLYQISTRYKALEELLGDESIPQEEINAALVNVAGEISEKADNIIAIIKNWEALMNAAKEEEQRLKAYKTVIKNRIERLKAATLYAMESIDKKKIESSRGTMTIKKNPQKLHITDENAIPAKYKIVIYEIDKATLKNDLKAGVEVPGATLASVGTNLSIR